MYIFGTSMKTSRWNVIETVVEGRYIFLISNSYLSLYSVELFFKVKIKIVLIKHPLFHWILNTTLYDILKFVGW